MDNEKTLHSLVSLISIDGNIAPEEQEFLIHTSERLGIPSATLNQLLDKVRNGQAKLHLPGDATRIRELFYLMVQAAVADGQVDPKEKKILELIASKAGLSTMDTSNAISIRLEQAVASTAALSATGSKSIDCPKCGFTQDEGRTDCIRCGIVFAKFQKEQDDVKQATAAMESLTGLKGLAIQQSKDWSESFTGFEVTNEYTVYGPTGMSLFRAAEQDSGLLMRSFLKAMRPFEIQVRENSSRRFVMQVSRPFRFFFHEATITGDRKKRLGTIKKKFSLVRRIYTVSDARGRELFELFGPILRPWTFEIMSKGRKIGKITKKWSGLATESFSDADNFGVTFPADLPTERKSILLGAVFLIDFVHFEDKGGNN